MQEEVTQKTIALVFKSSRLTADVLKKAMKMYLEHRKAGKQATHGKMSVKKLVGQGMGASSIEVTDNNIKSFERVARKYNVDFAVKKDKTVEPPKYMVFFKGKFTVEEINFMCVFETQDRTNMIRQIRQVMPHIENSDMEELGEQVLGKLQDMTDEEFAEISLEAAEWM